MEDLEKLTEDDLKRFEWARKQYHAALTPWQHELAYLAEKYKIAPDKDDIEDDGSIVRGTQDVPADAIKPAGV